MILQTGYFDDSGSDVGSQCYVLAGFIASVEDWKAVSTKWAQTLDKEPSLRYFKMSEAMAMDGQFRNGWTVPLRNQRIIELVDIIAELDPPRIECFLKRSHFDTFVKGIIRGDAFSDPYFICFITPYSPLPPTLRPSLGAGTATSFLMSKESSGMLRSIDGIG
jgi:hypothetical protein